MNTIKRILNKVAGRRWLKRCVRPSDILKQFKYLVPVICIIGTCQAYSVTQSGEFLSVENPKTMNRETAITHDVRSELGVNLKNLSLRSIQTAKPLSNVTLEVSSSKNVVFGNGEPVGNSLTNNSNNKAVSDGHEIKAHSFLIGLLIGWLLFELAWQINYHWPCPEWPNGQKLSHRPVSDGSERKE